MGLSTLLYCAAHGSLLSYHSASFHSAHPYGVCVHTGSTVALQLGGSGINIGDSSYFHSCKQCSTATHVAASVAQLLAYYVSQPQMFVHAQ